MALKKAIHTATPQGDPTLLEWLFSWGSPESLGKNGIVVCKGGNHGETHHFNC